MKNETFSENVFQQTLVAVRKKKHRQKQLRNGTIATLAIMVMVLLIYPPYVHRSPNQQSQSHGPSTDPHQANESTEDVIHYIDTETMIAMLGDRTHALVTDKNGKRRLWLPEN